MEYKWNVLYSYMAIDNISNKIHNLLYQISSKTLSTFLELRDSVDVSGEISRIIRQEIAADPENIMNDRVFVNVIEHMVQFLLGSVIDARDDRLIGLMNKLYRVIDVSVGEINRLILSIAFYTYSVDKDAKRNYDILCESGREAFEGNKRKFLERLKGEDGTGGIDVLDVLKLFEEYVLYYKNEVKRSIMYVQYDPLEEPEKFWNQFFTYEKVDYRNYPASFKKSRNDLIEMVLNFFDILTSKDDIDVPRNEIKNKIDNAEINNAILFNNYHDISGLMNAINQDTDIDKLYISIMEYIRNIAIYNFRYEQYYDVINAIINSIIAQTGASPITKKRIDIVNKIIDPKIRFIDRVNEIVSKPGNGYFANYAETLMDMVKYESDYNRIYRLIAIVDKLDLILIRLSMISDPIRRDTYQKRLMDALKAGDVELIGTINKDIIKNIGDMKLKESEIEGKRNRLKLNRVEIGRLEDEIAAIQTQITDYSGKIPTGVGEVNLGDLNVIKAQILTTARKLERVPNYYSDPDRKQINPQYRNIRLGDVGSIAKNFPAFPQEIQDEMYGMLDKYDYIRFTNLIEESKKRIEELNSKIADLNTVNESIAKDIKVYEAETGK